MFVPPSVMRYYIMPAEETKINRAKKREKNMSIKMIGIDYTTMSLSKREKYSLTGEGAAKLCGSLKEKYFAKGIVVISTCNRTEIWADGFKGDLEQAFFDSINKENAQVFTHRRSKQAVNYLFELACGMHSQIFGEDQILTQVKNALNNAREAGVLSGTLETLFRLAITSAKEVKTKVVLTDKNSSVPGCAIETVIQKFGDITGKKCLVIGNGEMGKLTANLLVEHGCKVTVTVRNYHRGAIIIPEMCRAIMYDERYGFIKDADIVFSATLSPHHTVRVKSLLENGYKKGCVFVDLALPRDIEEDITAIDDVSLINIENLNVSTQRDGQAISLANEILSKHILEFYEWCKRRDVAKDAKIVGKTLADICTQRVQGKLCEKCLDEDIIEIIGAVVQKSTERLVFGAKGKMEEQMYREAVAQFRQTAEDMLGGGNI